MIDHLPKAILLDLDDTILADSESARYSWQTVSEQFAPRIGCTPDELLATIREYAHWYWSDPERHHRGRLDLNTSRREIVAAALPRMGIDNPSLAAEIAQAHHDLRDATVKPFDGAIDVLRSFRDRGLRLALITNGNGDLQRQKIERFGLATFFDCILIEGEFGMGKPDERVYRHALDQLNVTPSEAWMVGDNLEFDVAAPQRLGIYSIWVDVTGNGLPASSAVRPDRIIRTLSELLLRT
ncbi:MAG: hypothetical protein A2Z21_10340 [Candidatus Fraserbacteria bacterium RBG_16_55_9]|uniref:Phosphoglycolate phosphatase n=1 Tax=Fraserbacteria sp. (strain RBG_16_55_9) TaxID=1817864 RepID=A0A1F5URT8_FRAXR|nr:MAG: hypothetical protein A2Z21_10340 [Candidatus Fraserbacteria bacterium RBG_16_55_9]